jgi:nitroimidazol reductase NimA-like FMN-containing flavoprotein (pyridoxamine 5'-phosphate oxidase superfamily)
MKKPMRGPRVSRPYMPGYGIRSDRKTFLPWSYARERLERARTYWIATARPDGRPHCVPVWGLWLEERFIFSTGADSRKARNLAVNPNCVVTMEESDRHVVVEGLAEVLGAEAERKRVTRIYQQKYDWKQELPPGPIFSVRPVVAFAFSAVGDEFTKTATRWRFE